MGVYYKTFGNKEGMTKKVLIPGQSHGNKIVEIVTKEEDLSETDGIYAKFVEQEDGVLLGVKTADCAPIVFWDDEHYGVVHCGWRGLVNGIVENMLDLVDTDDLEVWIGPMFPVFEIQKDECYKKIEQKFGSIFFTEKEGKIYFEFKKALSSLLPMAEFDDRSTFEDTAFASWRRDGDENRNVTVVGAI